MPFSLTWQSILQLWHRPTSVAPTAAPLRPQPAVPSSATVDEDDGRWSRYERRELPVDRSSVLDRRGRL